MTTDSTPAPLAPSAHATTTVVPRCVLVFACIYALAWALVPPLLAPSFPLDIVESLGWGREWQWGTYKHPPLPPIALHVFFVAFGRAGPFVLSQLCVAATLWLVWRTACRLVGQERAVLGTVLTMGVVFYTRPALEFNHNIAQMPLWAGICYFYLAAWQDGKTWQWLMLGLMAGLGLLCKYSIGILLLCLAVFTVLSPARALLRRPGPWLALAALLLVICPHLLWLHQHDWLPFAYARGRAGSPADPAVGAPQLGALRFLQTQWLNHLPLALVVLLAWALLRLGRRLPAADGPWRLHSTEPRYLLVIALGPGLLLALMGLTAGVRLRDMWGVPMWAFSGVLVAALLPSAWLASMRPYLLRGVAVWLVVISLLSGLYLLYVGALRQRPVRSDWPATALALQANRTWAQLSTCPLDTVAGDTWMAGLIATGASSQPSVLIPGDPRYSPWATPARARTRGALWAWLPEDTDNGEPAPIAVLEGMAQRPDMRIHQGSWSIPWPRAQQQQPLVVQWRALVPEACARR